MIYVRNILLLGIGLIVLTGCGNYRVKVVKKKEPPKNQRQPVAKVKKVDLKKSSMFNARLCAAYIRKKSYQVAMYKCNKALKHDPKNAVAHKWKAVLHQQLGQPELARKYYQAAIRLAPDDAGARNNFGAFLCQQKQYRQSEKQFLRAASNPLYGSRAFAYVNAGVCMQSAGDRDKAEKYFRLALSLDRNNAHALIRLAALQLDAGKVESAYRLMQRWSASNRQNSESLWLNIRIARLRGDVNRASSLGLLLVNKYPESTEAKRYRRRNN